MLPVLIEPKPVKCGQMPKLSKYFWILFSLIFFDLVSTTVGLYTGTLVEKNILMEWTVDIGVWFFIVYKIVLSGSGLAGLEFFWQRGNLFKRLYQFVIVAYVAIWSGGIIFYQVKGMMI